MANLVPPLIAVITLLCEFIKFFSFQQKNFCTRGVFNRLRLLITMASHPKYHLTNALPILLLLTAVFSVQPLNAATPTYSCPYAQTVNISDGLRLKDGSYLYAGLLIPANMTAQYNFKVVDGVLTNAPPHIRGCACRQRPCITFCCPPEQVFDEQKRSCMPHASSLNAEQQRARYAHIEVTDSADGSVRVVNITDLFVMRYEVGCSRKYIDKSDDIFWKWDLYAVRRWMFSKKKRKKFVEVMW